MKLLKVNIYPCRDCRNGWNRNRRCSTCGGRGYRIEDQSYEAQPDAPAPPRPILPKAPPQRDERTRKGRLADGHCGECGSPDLQTRTRCRACAEYHREINQIRRKTFPTE